MPTAFVLIRLKKNDAGAAERILEALRTSDAVKEAYRISESYTHIPRGYTVMAIVGANTMKELKSFLYLDLKYKIANWIESNPDALIWPPS